MIASITQADRLGFPALVESVNQIQEIQGRSGLPSEFLKSLGIIVRRRLEEGTFPKNYLAKFLRLHSGQLNRRLSDAPQWRESVLAVSDFCLREMDRNFEIEDFNIRNSGINEVIIAMMGFRYRDDLLLSRFADYLVNPLDSRLTFVDDIGDYLRSTTILGYSSERQLISLTNKARLTATGRQHEPLVHQGLTKVAWAYLPLDANKALESLRGSIDLGLIFPEQLNGASLLRMHQIYFANQAEADLRFLPFIEGAIAEQEDKRWARGASNFELAVEEVIYRLGLKYEREFPLAGYWVDFLIEFNGRQIVLECDHPLFHELVHLRTGEVIKKGSDNLREQVISAQLKIVRLSTTEWDNAKEKKAELILEKLCT